MEQYIAENLQTGDSVHRTRYHVIERFPKEFKKNWIKSVDPRFLTILISTFLITLLLGSYFYSLAKKITTDTRVRTIQENYVHILENDQYYNSIQEIFNIKEKNKDTYLYGASDQIPEMQLNNSGENIVETSTELTTSFASNQSGNNTANKKAVNRNKNIGQSSASKDVNSLGILNYITTDSKVSENSSTDILGFNADDIEIQFNNSQQNLEGSGVNKGLNNNYQLKGSKFKRATLDDAVVSIFPTRQAVSKVIKKNIDWEEIPSTNPQYTKQKRGGNGYTRSPEKITQVLASHNRAIQDCYKQALKKDTNLKGKIVIRFSVSSEGFVEDVKIINSTIENERMKECILRKISRWNDFGYCDPELGVSYYRQTYVFGY